MDATPVVQKRITWDGNGWECDPLHVVVYVLNRQTGQKEPVRIQPDWISVTCEPDVLEMETPEPAGEYAWRVPLKVTKDDIGPATIILGPSRPPQVNGTIGQYSEESLPSEVGAANPLKIKVTVTVNMVPEVASAALSMAGGIPFGIIRSATQLLKKELEYELVPPPFTWSVQQDRPVRLGPAKAQPPEMEIINLRCAPPKGWLFDVSVRFLIESRSIRLGLQSGGAQLVDSGSDEELAAQLQIAGTDLCLKPVGSVSADGSEGDVSLRFLAISESPYIGRRVSRFEVQARAQAVAVYFNGQPAGNFALEGYYSSPTSAFDWTDEDRVSVIGERHSGSDIPKASILPIAVRTPEGWDDPPVAWERGDVPDGEGPLDDRIRYRGSDSYASIGPYDPSGTAATGEASAEYIAPGAKRWKLAGEPSMRWLIAYVGRHDIIPIEGWEEESLWQAVPIYANVGLILRKYIAHLKMRVGPTDLMKENAVKLDLTSPEVEKSLIREVDVYLEIEE
jgi:hypothetical protein